MKSESVEKTCGRIVDHSAAPKRLQQCINAILQRSDTWQLSIASEKCNVLHIGKGNPKADYFLNTSKLEHKSSIRDLGIQIDDELSFKDHFDIITQKAATRANIIFRGLTTNNAKVMVNAYTTYVRPMVEFCPSVAFPVHEKEAGKLEKLQKNYKCFGYNFENRPRPEERNEMLKLKSLTYRRKINDFKHAYELLFGNSRLSRNQAHFLTLSKSNLRGAGYKVCKEPFKTKVREKSFANRIGNALYDVLRKGKIPTKYSEFMSVMSKEFKNLGDRDEVLREEDALHTLDAEQLASGLCFAAPALVYSKVAADGSTA
ncbi:hypothetical protein PRIPAC_78981 [Pristionchus pacificus]|uniref:Uncharacterized protein n=1 Tax=Pristionchus pacificus TaxID=54126 RepID=A0A2A6CN20_PRIPA|nr:hypothetical protein PRIPAC_78981 [Pristionchus pacificus]|eukprot:PDM79509.1 hypothetical protein PRIPAC_32088 [Pristionchus pacificus]